MKKKLLAVSMIGALALGTLAGCGGASTTTGGSANGPIKIGINFELTGGVAAFGNSALNAAKLATKEINAAGGVLGKQIELVVADNASKPDETARAAQKLISSDKVVAMIGATTSTNTLAAVPIANEKKVPMISSSATNPKVTVDDRTNKVNEWVFRACFIDPFQGKVMADFSTKDLKAKTAVIYTDTSSDYSKGLSKFFKETFTKNGGTIVAEESYQQKDNDFKAVLTRIKDKKPDVIYVPGYYEEVGKIVKQAREMGITVPMMGGDGWEAPQLFDIAGKENLNNTFISNHYANDDQAPEVQKFLTAYKNEYKGEMPDAMGVLGYDAVYMLADAIKRAGEATPEKIKNALASTKDFKAVTGSISLNENHDPVKAAVILEFKDGKEVFKTKVNP